MANKVIDISALKPLAAAPTTEEVEALTPEVKAKQLPEPKGYHILCMVPKADEKFSADGKIVKAESVQKVDEITTQVLFVVKLGDLAYKDQSRFPTGPWCKEGDFVITRAYAGTRFKVHGVEMRLLNDDSIEATVEDPRGINRVV